MTYFLVKNDKVKIEESETPRDKIFDEVKSKYGEDIRIVGESELKESNANKIYQELEKDEEGFCIVKQSLLDKINEENNRQGIIIENNGGKINMYMEVFENGE